MQPFVISIMLTSLLLLDRSDAEVIARTNEWLYSIGADIVHISPLADSITARFRNDAQRTWQHLPPPASHPLAFDFVIRRDAQSNVKNDYEKPRVRKPDVTYTVCLCSGFPCCDETVLCFSFRAFCR